MKLPGEGEYYVAEVSVDTNADRQHYAVPVALIWEENLQGQQQQLALARVRRASKMGMLTDAFVTPGFIHAIVTNLREASHVLINYGEQQARLIFQPQERLQDLDLLDDAELDWLGAEQSNSSVIIGYQAVLKQVRRVVDGINPEAEMTGYLTAQGYHHTPALLGQVTYEDDAGGKHTLMLLHEFVSNQGDAWTWTQEYLRRTLDEVALTGEPRESYDDLLASYAGVAGTLGRRLAELHETLSRDTEDAAFQPRHPQQADIQARANAVSTMVTRALEAISTHTWAHDVTQARVAMLQERAALLPERIQQLAAAHAGLLMRIHGDLHLGQVLIAQNDAYIIDFEGEPARSIEERRALSVAMRDVAGVLRSFDYAAAAVVVEQEALAHPDTGAGVEPSGTVRQNREALLQRFRETASASFLDSYRSTAQELGARWLAEDGGAAELELALLEKAAYEVCYEAANRPKWLDIPLRGLADTVYRVTTQASDAHGGGSA